MTLQAAAPSAPGLAAAVWITSYAMVVGGGRGERMSPVPLRFGGGIKKKVKIPPSPQRISVVGDKKSNPRALGGSVGSISPCPRRVVGGAQVIECKAPVDPKKKKKKRVVPGS